MSCNNYWDVIKSVFTNAYDLYLEDFPKSSKSDCRERSTRLCEIKDIVSALDKWVSESRKLGRPIDIPIADSLSTQFQDF